MGIVSRAVRNISRRKMRALLVIIALGFALAIMVSIPAGVLANEKTANTVATNLSNLINQTGSSINQTLNQVTCELPSSYSGFGFTPPSGTSGGTGTYGGGGYGGYGGSGSGSSGRSGFTPGQFGGGTVGGYFGGGALNGGQLTPMNETLYTDINSSISGIAAVEPTLTASEGNNVTFTFSRDGYSRDITTLNVTYQIEGVQLTSDLVDNYPILPTNITAGTNLQAGETGDVLLSENNSAYFNAGVGDSVNILGQSFTVIGIYSPSSVEQTQTLFMDLSDAQTITNNTGMITSIIVYTQSPSDVDSVQTAISALHPELSVTTPQDSRLATVESGYTAALASAQASDNKTNSTAIEEIVVVVLATSLIVLFVMLYTVKERTKEIGTLKAIGFSNSTVMSQFMLEGILLSMIAGVVGIVIGSVAAPTLASTLLPNGVSGITRFHGLAVATLTPELVLLGFGVAVLLGTLGSLYPAWRAAKIRPAEAMRYE
jgi:putative ABC transport system permease protein